MAKSAKRSRQDAFLAAFMETACVSRAAIAARVNRNTHYGWLADPAYVAAAVKAMRTSNKPASEAMVAVGINSATDITGFGLLAHLGGMMKASGTTARVSMAAVPLLPGVRELADRAFSGGTRRNHEAAAKVVRWHDELTLEDQLILCDAQTSGGLVLSVANDKADALLADLTARGVTGVVIGDVVASLGVEIEAGL